MDGRHHAREDWVMLVASRLERHGIPTGSESPRDVAERIYDETSGLTPHEGISYYRAELDRQNMTADERRKGEWIFACCKRISGLDECFTEMALDDFYDVAVLLWNDFGHVPVDRMVVWQTADWAQAIANALQGSTQTSWHGLDDFHQRSALVAWLAHVFPSATTAEPDDALGGWRGRVVIDLPTGQASWIYHDSDAGLFADLPAQSPAARHG